MRTKLIQAVSVLFALGLVALAAVAGGLYWDRVQTRAAQAAEAELPALAIQQIPRVFGYDFQTVERSLSEAATLLTPDYRREFEDRAAKDIIPQARERQVVSQAHAVGAGMLSAQRDSASVLVFMNRTVTDKSKESVYDGSRLKVDYQKVDGRWLISYITPI
ncbi:mammalian cell entry protein [Mycolicibacterium neoaurum]|uniref:mammalian cell entry protein n=1 Tax=Mycolicibacterium neoaurum TaxID=1795 RepID=UPI00248BC041|nr:mammalian cell entry protein [Mycolicibacterium neoaurum]WBP95322.1 mammalian cell entry protein [Mycolicibacterium neoaurum]WBS08380.1 mammalian cell entry protein [Mycolicibacterium neoaurum]